MWAVSSGDDVGFPLQHNTCIQTPSTHLVRAKAYGEQTEKATFGMPQMAVTDVESQLSFHLWQIRAAASVFKFEGGKNNLIPSEIFPSGSQTYQWHSVTFTAETECMKS